MESRIRCLWLLRGSTVSWETRQLCTSGSAEWTVVEGWYFPEGWVCARSRTSLLPWYWCSTWKSLTPIGSDPIANVTTMTVNCELLKESSGHYQLPYWDILL
jgi:hypothetical protein